MGNQVELHRLPANKTLIRVFGDLGGDALGELRHAVIGELTGSPELLVIDLPAVTSIDANVVDALAEAAAVAGEEDIALALVVTPNGPVNTGLASAGLTELFEIFSSVTEALDGYR